MTVRSVLIQNKEEVVAEYGMVVAESAEAAEAGTEIFEKGGNAIDAAVATSFAVCRIVQEPDPRGKGLYSQMISQSFSGVLSTVE